MDDVVLWRMRMRRDGVDLELVCRTRGRAVRLCVNDNPVDLPATRESIPTVMMAWPRALARTGWQLYDPEED
jgi:hypothetical protein